MKKKVLLIASLLLITGVRAFGADWQPIDANIPNFSIDIDRDSVNFVKENECVYAIRFRSTDKQEKVVYLKSNFDKNYLGVIQALDYNSKNYNPAVYLTSPHVFMKPVNGDSFLAIAHNYVASIADKNTQLAQNSNNMIQYQGKLPTVSSGDSGNIANPGKNVSFIKVLSPNQKENSAKNIDEYVSITAKQLYENWNPPKSGRNTQAIVIISINPDGSIKNYHFAKSSGDDAMDRSILVALKKNVPFDKFPHIVKNMSSLDFQFVFDYKYLRKSVI